MSAAIKRSFLLFCSGLICLNLFTVTPVSGQGGIPGGAPTGQPAPPSGLPGGQTAPTGSVPQTGADTGAVGNQQGNNKTSGNQTLDNNQQNNINNQQNKNNTNIAGNDQGAPLDSTQAALQTLRNKIFGHKQFSQTAFNPLANQPIATPVSYVVGPGDELEISIYGNTQQPPQKVTVNRDGYISLPRVGNVYVLGKNIDEITKILIGRYAQFNPYLLGQGGAPPRSTLKVSLTEVRAVQVYVTGEVMYPATYELTSLHTAFNALYLAGGPNEIGAFRDIKVIRNNEEIATIDTYEYFLTGKLSNNVLIQDNDRIVVGYYKTRVEVEGNVKKPGIYELKSGETLADLFRFAGGFTDDAYRAQYKVLRFTSRERKILDVSENEADSFELKSGDLVTVSAVLDRFENIVTIDGAVMRPGDYSLESNPTLKKLLESAQGLREDAFAGRVQISRTRADQSIENLSVNLASVINGEASDIPLTRLDIVRVPSIYEMTEQASVTITGEVNNRKFGENNGTFPYIANMTLEDLVVMADGFKESADLNNIQISRRKRDVDAKFADAQIAEVFTVSLNKDLSLRANEIILWPFDEVIVGKSPAYKEQQYVRIEGDGVLREGTYPIINRNDKISDIVKRAGGLTELAFLPGATLIRTSVLADANSVEAAEAEDNILQNTLIGNEIGAVEGTSKQESIGINMTRILKNPGSKEDLIVQAGDVIRIPKRLETVQVIGEVLYPTTVKYNDGMSFLDFISQSGGFTKASLRRSSWVKYPNGSVDRTRRFLVFNIYPKVQPGSEIYVPEKVGNELTPMQLLNMSIQVTSTLMTLILSILAFRNITN